MVRVFFIALFTYLVVGVCGVDERDRSLLRARVHKQRERLNKGGGGAAAASSAKNKAKKTASSTVSSESPDDSTPTGVVFPKDYRPLLLPPTEDTKPVYVKTNVAINRVYLIDATDGTCTLEIRLELEWKDGRLKDVVKTHKLIDASGLWKPKMM